MSTTYCLQVTEANHVEGEFYTLGGAGFLSERERQASIDSIPRIDHDCEDPSVPRCYLVDILDPADQFTIVDNFEISEETAHALLGVDNFDPIRDGERSALASFVAGAR